MNGVVLTRAGGTAADNYTPAPGWIRLRGGPLDGQSYALGSHYSDGTLLHLSAAFGDDRTRGLGVYRRTATREPSGAEAWTWQPGLSLLAPA